MKTSFKSPLHGFQDQKGYLIQAVHLRQLKVVGWVRCGVSSLNIRAPCSVNRPRQFSALERPVPRAQCPVPSQCPATPEETVETFKSTYFRPNMKFPYKYMAFVHDQVSNFVHLGMVGGTKVNAGDEMSEHLNAHHPSLAVSNNYIEILRYRPRSNSLETGDSCRGN